MIRLDNAPIRAGIAGAGLMGRWHAWAVEKSGGRVAAIADPDPVARQHLAARYPQARIFEEYERLLDAGALDVLHVCTPPPTHYRLAAAAIDAGIALLIEKPLAPTGTETGQLLDLARQRNVLIAPVHQFVFQDGVLRARNALAGAGRIVRITATLYSAGGDGMDSTAWDSVVADMLPHPLSLMQHFLATALPEDGWMAAHPQSGELAAWCASADTTLSLAISLAARPTRCALEIAGTATTIHLDLYHGYAVIEPGRVSRARKIAHPFDWATRTLVAAAANLARRAVTAE